MLRGAIVCSGLIALTVWAPRVAAAPSAPVPAPPGIAFTPDVRADTVEGSATGQNEPVTAVDQTGKTYITWQGGAIGGNGCPTQVPVKRTSWGQVKSLYR